MAGTANFQLELHTDSSNVSIVHLWAYCSKSLRRKLEHLSLAQGLSGLSLAVK